MSKFNAFIGQNNSGKSNIMRALNLVLGESYPTIRSIGDEDYYNCDSSSKMVIEIRFDHELLCNPLVMGFRLECQGSDFAYFAIDSDGQPLTYGYSSNKVKITNEMREEVALLYLGIDRQSSQQIRSNKWTLYGKLLRHITKTIDADKKERFTSSVEQSYRIELHPDITKMEEILKGHLRKQTGLELNMRLSILDPLEVIGSMRPFIQDPDGQREFDSESAGAGVQSALSIGIARAYAQIVRRPLTVVIEEPELYLHPHGCRHFYKLLRELSDEGVQIIYTTHERSFVQLADYKSIYIVRKVNGETSVSSSILSQVAADDSLRHASKFDEAANEVFFASHVIFVEGFSDKIACRLALEKIGLEMDRDNISIVECNGIKSIKGPSSVLKGFNIPVVALVDGDPGNQTTFRAVTELRQLLGTNNVILQDPNLEGVFGLPGKLEKPEYMEFFPIWFEENEPPEIYQEIARIIREEHSGEDDAPSLEISNDVME